MLLSISCGSCDHVCAINHSRDCLCMLSRTGLIAKVERSEAYRPVKNLRVSIIIIICATFAFGVICSLLVARVLFPFSAFSTVSAYQLCSGS